MKAGSTRVSHYVPTIRRQLVAVLYQERKRRGIPMTKLVDEILTKALKGTDSWKLAEEPNVISFPSVGQQEDIHPAACSVKYHPAA